MALAAPGSRPDRFRMNSNALEPACLSLVGHPTINASSIALTNITLHSRPGRNNSGINLTHKHPV